MDFWRLVGADNLGSFSGPLLWLTLAAGCALGLLAAWLRTRHTHQHLARTGDALRDSEACNHAIITAMLDAHVTVDRQGRIRSFNPAAEEVFGWPAADIIGQPVRLLINGGSDADRRDWAARSDRLVALPAAYRRRVHPQGGRRRDGSVFPLELAISEFAAGGQQLFSCTVRDLSGRWEQDARLRHLASAIECAGDAIVIMGPDQAIQYVNAQYEHQTGLSRDEIMGRQLDVSIGTRDVCEEIRAAAGQGIPWTGQVRTQRRDGGNCIQELTVTPVLDGDGKLSATVAVARDITRRLEAQLERRRLAEALQHCADSIEIIDAQGRIVYVNAAFEARSGQRLAEIRGSRPEALLDFSTDAASYEEMMRTAYRGGRPWSGTLQAHTPDGELLEQDVSVAPMRDEHDTITGYVIVKRDVAERRRPGSRMRQEREHPLPPTVQSASRSR